MSVLYKKLLDERAYARGNKHQDTYRVLTLVVGEVETAFKRTGVEPTDDLVERVIRKMIKSNNEVLGYTPENFSLRKENALLETYLPKVDLIDEPVIRQTITEAGCKNVGECMAALNKLYSGRFDKAVAAKIAREMVS